MSDLNPPRPFPYEPAGGFNGHTVVPGSLIVLMTLVLAGLALLGGYRGLTTVRHGPGSTLLNPQSLIQGKAVSADQVVPIVRDTDWSTLKGPQILASPSAKPAAAAAANEDAADSGDAPDADAPAAETARAEAATPVQAPRAAPPADQQIIERAPPPSPAAP